jgi:phage-related protein
MAKFTYIPDFGAAKKIAPRVNAISFGDGYEQRATFGINNNPQSWDLSFANRSDADAQAIDDFLTARAGVESFDWTPYNQSAGKYICKEWSKSIDKYNGNTIQATFMQVFENI